MPGPWVTTYLRCPQTASERPQTASEPSGTPSERAAGEPGGRDQGYPGSVGQVDVRRGVQDDQVGLLPRGQGADVVAVESGRTTGRRGVHRLAGGHPHLPDGEGDAE